MDNSFGIWLLAAGVAAVGLLLLLGAFAATPEGGLSSELEAAPALDLAEAGSVDGTSSYWKPVVEGSPLPQVVHTPVSSVASVGTTAPCPHCGSTAAVSATSTPSLAKECGYPSTPCGRPACPRCHGQAMPAVPAAMAGDLVGGCGRPSALCGEVLCAPIAPRCSYSCADTCRTQKPGINRNMPLCIDECSFLQLRSTVSHPICGQVRFEWSASKGRFLDPTASDPLFFAPTTQFGDGEDIWITLMVTDASGAQYSDVVSVHIRDLP
jgi:hypothetical protein